MSGIGPNKNINVFPGPDNDNPATLRECREELRWMSGSNDFSPGGFARIGWDKGPGPLLARLTDEALDRDENRRVALEQIAREIDTYGHDCDNHMEPSDEESAWCRVCEARAILDKLK